MAIEDICDAWLGNALRLYLFSNFYLGRALSVSASGQRYAIPGAPDLRLIPVLESLLPALPPHGDSEGSSTHVVSSPQSA